MIHRSWGLPMGIARLLAKGWVVFCLFGGAHALRLALQGGQPVGDALQSVVLPVLLFVAMGLLFIGGYGASAMHGSVTWKLDPRQLIPGFNELVFIAFSFLSLANQIFFAPEHVGGAAATALEAAIGLIVPRQRALEGAPSFCLDRGRIFA